MLNKNKKAQTQMIFMFILAALIIGLIVLLGYKGITTITKTSDTASLDRFVNDLKSDIKSIYRMRRSSKVITYKVPSRVHKVCITSSVYPLSSSTDVPPALTAYDSEKTQLFLLSKDGIVIKDEELLLDVRMSQENNDGYFCQTNKGRLDLRLEGGGDHIIIGQE